MDNLENELRAAFRREAAPPGFAERVLARVNPEPRPRPGWWRAPAVRWALAAALLVAFVAGGLVAYQSWRRARGERAREQVILALQITGSQLHAVRAQIARMDRTQGESQ
jgi:hypothetical protein